VAAVEIICPHCNGKQKIPESRLNAAAHCLHCNQIITDAYLYKVKPPEQELAIKMRGKLVTDFGTTEFANLRSKADAYTGGSDEVEKAETDDFQALKDNVPTLTPSGTYYKVPVRNKVTTSGRRIYVLFGLLLVVCISVIGFVAWETFMRGGESRSEILGEGGERIQHFEDGQVRSRGQLKRLEDGREVLHGNWREYYSTGQVRVEGTYNEGRRTGQWREWHRNERLAAEYTYNDDSLEGEYRRWHTSGRRAVERFYQNGLRQGHWREWHRNGTLAVSRHYNEGNPVGIWTTWHPDGSRHTYGNHEDGQRHGRWVALYDTGRDEQIDYYRDGLLHGSSIGYHRNGTVSFRGDWEEGLQVGEWRWWYPTGREMRSGTYINGRKHGTWEEWQLNGAPVFVRHYDNGTNTGEWLEYDRDGKLWLRRVFSGGILASEQAYYRGEQVERRTKRRDTDGPHTLEAEWTVLDTLDQGDVRHGWYFAYHDNGNLRMQGTYRSGKRHGTFRHYDEGGSLYEITHWNNGVPAEDQ
jgi:antitoxin component YwqK of YwqJK toxin-antitoxin module